MRVSSMSIPLVRYVTVDRPRQECWDEIVTEPVRPFGVAGPTIAGGVVGAAVGRQFGSGSGQDALTLIGAVVGSAVGHQHAVRNQGYATRDGRGRSAAGRSASGSPRNASTAIS